MKMLTMKNVKMRTIKPFFVGEKKELAVFEGKFVACMHTYTWACHGIIHASDNLFDSLSFFRTLLLTFIQHTVLFRRTRRQTLQ